MLHIIPDRLPFALPLHGSARSRQIEAASMVGLPAHALMQRAALAVYRLGRALYPHARQIWVACGPGNNGGDGLWAAAAWQALLGHSGVQVTVTWAGTESKLPDDARFALQQAHQAGVHFADEPPASFDLAIDALLGLGVNSTPHGRIGQWIARLQACQAPVLCVDLPSGLNPDSGQWFNHCPALSQGPRHTLALLTLKPGLFTASGRDACGDLWFDPLGCETGDIPPDAWLHAATHPNHTRPQRHATHKGSHGDLLVLGGQDVRINGQGMTGAALLAARAGLQAGAGRVYLGLLAPTDAPTLQVDPLWPELMLREAQALAHSDLARSATSVCGCGAGQAVHTVLPTLLAHSPALVLDADALNAMASEPNWQTALAQRHAHGQISVLTPHPLEAARLLGCTAADIQGQRLRAAQDLALRYQSVVVLKGSGTVVAAPGKVPRLMPTGNALLSTAGTGDVLAGMIGAHLAQALAQPELKTPRRLTEAFAASCEAAHRHGMVANNWPDNRAFSASSLLQAIVPA